MTQQYIAGELSSFVAALGPAANELGAVVSRLRWEIEVSPLEALPKLTREALNFADRLCWAALESGDVASFARSAASAVALSEFATSADLLP